MDIQLFIMVVSIATSLVTIGVLIGVLLILRRINKGGWR